MRHATGPILLSILSLGGCSVFDPPVGVPCAIGPLQPSITTFDEFRNELLNNCQVQPQAITSPGKSMIYIAPKNGDTLFWFTNGRLTKITQRDPDAPNASTHPIRGQ